jgi:multiple sugar transport system permease protein
MPVSRFSRALQWAALLFFVALLAGPIAVALVSSLKLERDIFTYAPVIVFTPTLENYADLLRDWPKFWAALANSLAITVGAVLLVLAASLPAAYAYSRFATRALGLTTLFLIAVRMFPPLIITVPLFPIFTGIGLDDTHLALVLLYGAFQVSMATLMLKTFIDNVPAELEEAALIDGCSRKQAFFRILVPAIRPGITAAAIFVTIFAWNDYLFALVIAVERSVTAPVVLGEMLGQIGENNVGWGTVFAAATVQMAPVLLFVWIIQRQMLRGGASDALKG